MELLVTSDATTVMLCHLIVTWLRGDTCEPRLPPSDFRLPCWYLELASGLLISTDESLLAFADVR